MEDIETPKMVSIPHENGEKEALPNGATYGLVQDSLCRRQGKRAAAWERRGTIGQSFDMEAARYS